MLFSPPQKWFIRPAAAVFLSLSVTLAWADEDGEAPGWTARSNNYGVLQMTSEKQLESGLKTGAAQPAYFQEEFETTGKIISIEPLLALRERYLVAKAEHKAAKARLNQVAQSLKRHEELFKNGISSKRSLQELRAQKLSESSSIEAAEARLAAIASETRLNWGNVLPEWALAESANNLKPFLSGQEFIVLLVLPAGKTLQQDAAMVHASDSGRRDAAQPATLIGRAGQIDTAAQGESYFFRMRGEHYRTGMKLAVWIPDAKSESSGVIVPEPAVIWYMDQPYIYVKQGKDHFSRRTVSGLTAAPGGYFIKEGLKAGEEVVTSGAQMLLSEELRRQIPGEDQ